MPLTHLPITLSRTLVTMAETVPKPQATRVARRDDDDDDDGTSQHMENEVGALAMLWQLATRRS